jgi:hypothetical protein
MCDFPPFEVLSGNAVIPIAETLCCNVDSYASANQSFNRDLVQRLPALGKVNGGIDMGASMFSHFHAIRGIVIPALCLSRLLKDKPEVLFGRPDDRACLEGMGEIYEPRLLPGKTIIP